MQSKCGRLGQGPASGLWWWLDGEYLRLAPVRASSLYDGLCYLGNKREQHTGEVPAPQKDQRAPLCFRQAVLWRKPGRTADSHVPFLFLVKQGRACYWPGANLR